MPELAAFPSPSTGVLHLGPFPLRAYGLLMAAAIVTAIWWSERRWQARGGAEGVINGMAGWAVIPGIVGARLYHVLTSLPDYAHRPLAALEIWHGGLGVWGGVAGGVAGGLFYARRHHLDVAMLFDVVAPTIPLAQAIGRWGNYFNQELFGRPTTLPWALRIDPAHRPSQFAGLATYHPTFLYECLWNLGVVALLLVIERSGRLRRGRLFAAYVALYTAGRVWIEALRVDPAPRVAGLRLNVWTSLLVLAVSSAVVLASFRGRGPANDRPSEGDPLTATPEPHETDAR